MTAAVIARSVIRTLINNGVEHIVVCPGSRSGPLALAALDAERAGVVTLHVRIDERTAGFLALGIAKTSGKPAVVLTTSGTAVANVHPAMLEAKHSHIPLIALTADRPAHLRGTGANQTTDQRNIFPGIDFINIDAPVNDLTIDAVTQINVELDDPLYAPSDDHEPWRVTRIELVTRQVDKGLELETGKRTVVVAGDSAGEQARLFAEAANLPLLAEPSSNARSGPNMIRTYRLLLSMFAVERVVMFGHPTLSRPINNLLATTEVVVVGEDFSQFPHPPVHAQLSNGMPQLIVDDSDWLKQWQDADQKLSTLIDNYVDSRGELTPFHVAREITEVDSYLYLGSSSPIRDLDIMAGAFNNPTFANRGLAGIDGTISSAIGAAIASGKPVVSYVGDLTFLHDANGLLIGPDEQRPDVRFVVLNDDGGAIFSILEQGGPDFAGSFERVFATPTGANIAQLCAAYGITHHGVDDLSGLRVALAKPISGLSVVEVRVSRNDRRSWNEELNTLGK